MWPQNTLMIPLMMTATLRGTEEVSAELARELQDRLAPAGVEVWTLA